MGPAGMSGVLFRSGISLPSLTVYASSSDMKSLRVVDMPKLMLLARSRRRSKTVGNAGIVRGAMDEDEGGPRKDPGVDWDKAWTNFSSPQKKKSFLNIDMEQYVSRRPEHSNYPLSEEVDPLRKTERSALAFWSSSQFLYVLVGIIVLLFIYMVIIVGPPPSR